MNGGYALVLGVLLLLASFVATWCKMVSDSRAVSYIERVDTIKWHEKRDLKRIIHYQWKHLR